MDDIIFSHNWPYVDKHVSPRSFCMTLSLYSVAAICALGAESAVPDCFVVC